MFSATIFFCCVDRTVPVGLKKGRQFSLFCSCLCYRSLEDSDENFKEKEGIRNSILELLLSSDGKIKAEARKNDLISTKTLTQIKQNVLQC